MYKMYGELADWWPLLSPPEEYAEEAEILAGIISGRGFPESASLLELGCGGGSNVYHFKKMFAQVTLTDTSQPMLEVSRKLNPDCEHRLGDMRNLRLDRQFDMVFIHDAIDYMLTSIDLGQAIETAFVHSKPGALAIFAPDHVRETFDPSTDHGGTDGTDRALRYLEWTYDPDENDTTYTMEFAYLLREGDGPVRVLHEQHLCGLFPRAEWLRLLHEIGFQPETVRDPYGRDLFVARKPVL